MGARINITGDTLTLVTKYAINNTITQGAVPAVFDAKMEGIMKFKKQ